MLIINLWINQGHVGTILNIIVSQCVQSHPTTLYFTCNHKSLVPSVFSLTKLPSTLLVLTIVLFLVLIINLWINQGHVGTILNIIVSQCVQSHPTTLYFTCNHKSLVPSVFSLTKLPSTLLVLTIVLFLVLIINLWINQGHVGTILNIIVSQCVQSHPTTLYFTCNHNSLVPSVFSLTKLPSTLLVLTIVLFLVLIINLWINQGHVGTFLNIIVSQCVQSHPTTLYFTCNHNSLVPSVFSLTKLPSTLLVLTIVLFLVLIINLWINQGHVGTILNIIVSQCVQSHPTTLYFTCNHKSLVPSVFSLTKLPSTLLLLTIVLFLVLIISLWINQGHVGTILNIIVSQCVQSHPTTLYFTCNHNSLVPSVFSLTKLPSTLLVLTIVLFLVLIINLWINQGHVGTILNIIVSQCVQSHPTTLYFTCTHHSLVPGADHQSVDQSGPCLNHLEHFREPVCSVSPNYPLLYLYSP